MLVLSSKLNRGNSSTLKTADLILERVYVKDSDGKHFSLMYFSFMVVMRHIVKYCGTALLLVIWEFLPLMR